MTPHLLLAAGLLAVAGCGLDSPADAPPPDAPAARVDPAVGPGDPEVRAEWARNRALWEQTRPARYSLVEEVSCECNPPFRLTALVRATRLDSVTIDPEEAATWLAFFGDVYTYQDAVDRAITVDSSFALVEEGLRRADSVFATYDPALGYPTQVSITWNSDVADGGVSRTFSDLRVLP